MLSIKQPETHVVYTSVYFVTCGKNGVDAVTVISCWEGHRGPGRPSDSRTIGYDCKIVICRLPGWLSSPAGWVRSTTGWVQIPHATVLPDTPGYRERTELHTSSTATHHRITVISVGGRQKTKGFSEGFAVVGMRLERRMNAHCKVSQLVLVGWSRQSKSLTVARIVWILDVFGKCDHTNL